MLANNRILMVRPYRRIPAFERVPKECRTLILNGFIWSPAIRIAVRTVDSMEVRLRKLRFGRSKALPSSLSVI